MDNDTYQHLSRVPDDLMQVCRWLNGRRDTAMAATVIPITDDLTRLVAEMSEKQCRVPPDSEQLDKRERNGDK